MYFKGHVEMVNAKYQSNAIVYGTLVDTVNIGICCSYTTPYTEYYEM